MEKLNLIYRYIIKYKVQLIGFLLFAIILSLWVNYQQRIKTLDAFAINNNKVAKIDTTTLAILDIVKEYKQEQDSMKVIVDHLPTGSPLHAKDITRKSSNYGYRYDPISKLWTFHAADDFAVKPGTPVYATGAGVVIKAEMNASLGKYITIDNGYGYETTFAHLSRIDALPGYIVRRGDPIAIAGNTGWSTGTHLHYVVRYVGKNIDPDKLMQL
jgi:murein DD-endopeptidase MepM/ murein hydrolase activator NlpD